MFKIYLHLFFNFLIPCYLFIFYFIIKYKKNKISFVLIIFFMFYAIWQYLRFEITCPNCLKIQIKLRPINFIDKIKSLFFFNKCIHCNRSLSSIINTIIAENNFDHQNKNINSNINLIDLKKIESQLLKSKEKKLLFLLVIFLLIFSLFFLKSLFLEK